MSDASNLVTVAQFGTPVEAEMARGRLESEGIRAFLRDDMAVGMQPHLSGLLGGVRLAVAERDAAAATEILGDDVEPPEQLHVYRLRRTQALAFGLVGAALVFAATLASALWQSLPVAGLALTIGGAVAGAAVGARQISERCSNATCEHRLEGPLTQCPGCGRSISE